MFTTAKRVDEDAAPAARPGEPSQAAPAAAEVASPAGALDGPSRLVGGGRGFTPLAAVAGECAPGAPATIDPSHFGRAAEQYFVHAGDMARGLESVMLTQAELGRTVVQNERDYAEANEQHDAAKKPGTLAGIFEIVSFASSLVSVVGAGHAILKAALELKHVHTATRQWNDHVERQNRDFAGGLERRKYSKEMSGPLKEVGKATYEAPEKVAKFIEARAKVLGEMPTTDKLLPRANHVAIGNLSDAVTKVFGAFTKLNMMQAHQQAEKGGRALYELVRAMEHGLRKGALLANENECSALLESTEAARRAYLAESQKIEQIWTAFLAGGAEALADRANEGSLFEKIAAWKRTGDPRAGGVHVALDQDRREVDFDILPVEDDPDARDSQLVLEYTESITNLANAALYVTDPAARKELEPHLRTETEHFVPMGEAEMRLGAGKGEAFKLSESAGRALISLGVPHEKTMATVSFKVAGTEIAKIERPRKGAWFDGWRSTPEFARFWKRIAQKSWLFMRAKGSKESEVAPWSADHDSLLEAVMP